MRKRIMFILGSMGKGGAERVISILSRDYADNGWDTVILLLLNGTVAYDLHPSTSVIDISRAEISSRIRRLPYWIRTIHSLVKQYQPDVVLSFAARINIIAHIAARSITPRLYVSERNDPYMDERGRVIDFATSLLYPRDNAVIFQTKRAQGYFPRLRNGTIIPNPISVEAFATPQKNKRIVSVGSLRTQKNQTLLVNAFSMIAEKYPEYSLDIYGEGPLREQLHAIIERMQLANRVHLNGTADQIHSCIADAELFVLSSDYEGLSNALLEAMMMGLPCISTCCAGADEYIRNRENGMLTPVGDVNALAEAMDEMLGNKDLSARCGAQAKLDSTRYDAVTVLKQWHNLMDGNE